MELGPVIQQLGILFLIIGIGYAAAKCRVFPQGTNRVLAQLVINVTNPATVLYSVLGAERGLSNREVYLLTAIAVGYFVVVVLLGLILPRLLRCREEERRLYAFMATFSNMGFLGFPVISAVYGPNAVFYASIFNLMFQLVVYTYGVSLMNGKNSKLQLSWKTFFSPMIICSIIAYVCYLTNAAAPEIVVKTIGMLSNVTSPVCMLVIGIALANVPVGKVFTNWRLYVINAIRLLALPVLVWLVLRPLHMNPLILGVTVVISAMPVATMTTLFAAKYGKNEELAASGVFLSTLMSLGTIPLLMWLLFT